MRKVNFKGRCEKRVLSKCKSVFKSYDPIQNVFADKLEGLDAVSIGPDMLDIHTPDEKLSISSAQRTWDYLLKVLAALK